ncbi:MAG: serine/threonine-protein kinase, partial [Verrucomicrobiota bacterium]
MFLDVTIDHMGDANTISCPACAAELDTHDAEPLARVTCPNCGERVRAPRSFDHFELEETLGTGGMGTVYKARDTRLERHVALKLLRKELGAHPEHTRQLQQEAKITALINHPNVVQVFSLGNDHNQFYLVMELVEHGSLDDLIEEQRQIPEARALQTGIEVAKGLRAAYQKGLIHRDVKPANILFGSGGTAKITDFGLAGISEPQGSAKGEIWGTPYYVAPERLNNAPDDFRGDIYSLGASLFHALAGQPPFEGTTNSATQLRVLKDHPLQLERIAQDVSPATARTIGRMIAADPQARFGSYDDVIDALEKAHEALTRPPRDRGGKKTWILATAASLAAAAAVTWYLHRPTPPASATGSAATTATSSPARLSAFAEARRMVLTGRYPEAIAAFNRLASENQGRHPLYDWARLNQALAALLGKEPAQMRRALTEVEKSSHIDFSDPGLAALLIETAKRGNTRSTIELADVPAQSDRSFPLLFLGLVDVDLGRFHDAATLLEASLQAMKSTTGEATWAADYQPIAQKYLEDIHSFLAWRDQYAQAKTAAQVRAALESVRQLTPGLEKGTAMSREAALGERTLANQLGRSGAARNKPKEERGQAQNSSQEQPKWDAARESFRRHAAIYDFAGASDA